jgi:hypothetical protein
MSALVRSARPPLIVEAVKNGATQWRITAAAEPFIDRIIQVNLERDHQFQPETISIERRL